MDFIQVERIVKDKNGVQKISPEVISVNEIHTFRPWHKGENDTYELETVTLLVMKLSGKVTGQANEKSGDLPTMIIHETFTNFIKRMSGRVIVIGNAQ